MARNVVDIAIVEIDGSEVESITSFDINEVDQGAEPVVTMRRARAPIGHKEGVSWAEMDIEAKKLNPPEIDWLEWKRAGKIFTVVYEEAIGGTRYRVSTCKIYEVGKGFNADGEATDRVKVTGWLHRKEL